MKLLTMTIDIRNSRAGLGPTDVLSMMKSEHCLTRQNLMPLDIQISVEEKSAVIEGEIKINKENNMVLIL